MPLVVHVGAHLGEEARRYRDIGCRNVIWIEADPELVPRLKTAVAEAEKDASPKMEHAVVAALISDAEGDDLSFYRFSNDGASSSVYRATDQLRERWPDLDETGDVLTLPTRRLDGVLAEQGVSTGADDSTALLVIDVQGHEIAVLKGLGDYARRFDYIEVEVSRAEIYEGGSQYDDLHAVLDGMGYALASHRADDVPWHGDVVYARKAR